MVDNYVGGLPMAYPGELHRGDRNGEVKLLQEFLCLQGADLALDGDFGNLTFNAVMDAQRRNRLPKENIITEALWGILTAAYESTIQLRDKCPTLEETALEYARGHWSAGACELAKQNLGPWVRLYTGGHEGIHYPWCAGFVSFCIKQAGLTFDLPKDKMAKLPSSLSVTDFANWAEARSLLITSPKVDTAIKPGSLFLIRKRSGGWSHIGFIDKLNGSRIETIEGNTNAGGSPEGTSVMKRSRLLDSACLILKYSGKTL